MKPLHGRMLLYGITLASTFDWEEYVESFRLLLGLPGMMYLVWFYYG